MSALGQGVATVSTAELLGLNRLAMGLRIQPQRGRAPLDGSYHSAFKGRGMEFAEVRPYEAGDDIRLIDWRVTARTGRAHTKVFREERERPVMFWIDYRASMFFATRGVFKAVLAARLASLLAWTAYHHGDRVGGFIIGGSERYEARPASGLPPILRLLGQLATHAAWQQGPALPTSEGVMARAMSGLRRVTRPGTLVFVISDFRGFDAASLAHLGRIAEHSHVVCVFIHDVLEAELPDRGRYALTDGQQALTVDTDSPDLRERYRQSYLQRLEQLETLRKRHGIRVWPCRTTDDPVSMLRRALLQRAGTL
jgi:uncharacterized protein (DUF58 family)